MSLAMIAAVGKNRELGKKGGLVFHIPGDLRFFKETTMGHPVFMGLNTWNSLPKKLPGREHYVLAPSEDDVPSEVNAVTDLNQFIKDWQEKPEKIFVIGGGSVYAQTIDFCDEIYLTEVDGEDKEADVFFPDFDKTKFTKKIIKKGQDNDLTYSHVLYTRK